MTKIKYHSHKITQFNLSLIESLFMVCQTYNLSPIMILSDIKTGITNCSLKVVCNKKELFVLLVLSNHDTIIVRILYHMRFPQSWVPSFRYIASAALVASTTLPLTLIDDNHDDDDDCCVNF